MYLLAAESLRFLLFDKLFAIFAAGMECGQALSLIYGHT